MKFLASVPIAALLFAEVAAADPAGAVLRCDPATLIKRIDGDLKAYHNAGNGTSYEECEIPLAPGAHTISVCYDVVPAGAGPVVIGGVCSENRELAVNAEAGHTYRIKLSFRKEWTARIEDVTVTEADLSYARATDKPKPTGSKKERETILILQATPEYAFLTLQKGVPQGKWFTRDVYGGLKPFDYSTKGMPGGFHVVRAYAGDSIAVTNGKLLTGSIFVPKFVVPCGDFPVRVYEDIPAGKVLYLGHLSINESPPGYVGEYSDNIDAARTYLRAHYPDYAERLEPAKYRIMKETEVCRGQGTDLTGTPLGLDN